MREHDEISLASKIGFTVLASACCAAVLTEVGLLAVPLGFGCLWGLSRILGSMHKTRRG